ncbi:hypothetical protein [Pseudonocardia spinosispora]|uniref:hypothetical protein n=1 Tax=Pseudonocardia spinosispora TaxID=103441 RepID=UPI00040B08EA|nr:hypothetical protein [Pseudonocardia spinosispora]
MTLEVRQASLADLDDIMSVEADWEESQRASREQMATRLEKFAAGFWLYEQDGEVVGTLMSFPLRYAPEEVSQLSSWDRVTNEGDYPDIDLASANGLYLASGSIKKRARGSTVYVAMMETPVDAARDMGLRYVLAGAKIPGYDAYCRRFGDVDAADYAFRRLGGALVDPLLEMYRGHDYHVPDRAHIVKDYYPDPPSRDYGALVVRTL